MTRLWLIDWVVGTQEQECSNSKNLCSNTGLVRSANAGKALAHRVSTRLSDGPDFC